MHARSRIRCEIGSRIDMSIAVFVALAISSEPVALDSRLWPPRRPHADARLRGDARGRDGSVRQKLVI
jgi:hypothetical protein